MIATMKRWLLHMVMIGLLAAACPVHAFYNPSTGKWLSRDLIEEHGGKNISGLAVNDLNNHSDRLGLSFKWMPPSVVPMNTPLPIIIGQNTFFGYTDWVYFRPLANSFKSIDSPCCWKINISGSCLARGYYWQGGINATSEYDPIEVRDHEWIHINQHFLAAYNLFNQEASGLISQCMPRKKADCLAGVIMGKMGKAYEELARAMGASFDCNTYGYSNGSSEACTRAASAANRWIKLHDEYEDALKMCLND